MADQSTPKDASRLEAEAAGERPLSKSARGQIKTYDLPTPKTVNTSAGQRRRYIMLGVWSALALALLLTVGAIVQLFVLAPRESVATVGGVSISKLDVQNRSRLDFANLVSRYDNIAQTVQQAQAAGDEQSAFLVQFYQQQLQQLVSQFDASTLARNSLNSLVSEQIIRQEAAKRGISVNDADVQASIEEQFGFRVKPPEPGSTEPPATPVPEATFRDSYNNVVTYYKNQGLTEQDFRKLFELRVIEERLRETFTAEVPKSDVHYRFNYLRMYSETQAAATLAQAQAAPATFGQIISATSAITESNVGDGELQEWALRKNLENRFGDDVLKALDALPAGQVAAVFSPTINSFYIVQPLGKETRPLSKTDLEAATGTVFNDWLKKQEADPAVVSNQTTDLSSLVPRNIRDQITNFRRQMAQQ